MRRALPGAMLGVIRVWLRGLRILVTRRSLPMTRCVVLAAMVAAIGGSLCGYDTGVISGAILFVKPEFGLGTTQEELVISAALVGATIGAIASGRLTDKGGRRAVVLGGAVR